MFTNIDVEQSINFLSLSYNCLNIFCKLKKYWLWSLINFVNFNISSNVKTWGKEIYFHTDVVANKEPDAKSIIEFGEIAYWPAGKVIAIGFGKTPISQNDEIRLADDCNVWGKTNFDLKNLDNITEGKLIKIEKI